MTVFLLGNARELEPYATQMTSVLPETLDVLVLHSDLLPAVDGESSEISARAVGFLRAEVIQAALEFYTGQFALDRSVLEDIAGSISFFPMNNARIFCSTATPDPYSDEWGPIICAGGVKQVVHAPDQAVIVLPPSNYSGHDYLRNYLNTAFFLSNSPLSSAPQQLKPNGYFLAKELARLYLYATSKSQFRTSFEFALTDKFASDVCVEAGKTDLVDLMMPAQVLTSLLSELTPSAVVKWNALALQSDNQEALTYQTDVCAALELRFRVSECLCPSAIVLPATRDEIVREAFASVGAQGAASAFESLLVRTAQQHASRQINALDAVVVKDTFQWPETKELALLSQKAARSLLSHL